MVEGENTFEELNRLTENLTFQDSSVIGWFYIKD